MSPDPYEPDYEDRAGVIDEYELPEVHRRSLREIRQKLDTKGYKDPEEIHSHQEFLEDLNNHLRVISENEKKRGEVNWELDRQMGDIKNLYMELEKVRKEIASKKTR